VDANTIQLLVEGMRLVSVLLTNRGEQDEFELASKAAKKAEAIAAAEGRDTVLPNDVSRAVDAILAENAGRLAVLRPKVDQMLEETGVTPEKERTQ